MIPIRIEYLIRKKRYNEFINLVGYYIKKIFKIDDDGLVFYKSLKFLHYHIMLLQSNPLTS